MIIKKLTSMITKCDDKTELEMYLEKTKKDDGLKAEAYANRSTYVNCTTLRLNGETKPSIFAPLVQFNNCSPV